MFHDRGDDDIVGLEVEPVGELVNALSRILREDDGVPRQVSPDEVPCSVMGAIEYLCCQQRLESRPAVNARIPRKEFFDAPQNAPQCGSACPVVEKCVLPLGPIKERNPRVNAHDVGTEITETQCT